MPKNSNPENDPLYHTQNVKNMFDELITHLREDIERIDDPQAKAMFETSAEVVLGLKKTFDHYEKESEEAWRG